jgi:hypothetical protein
MLTENEKLTLAVAIGSASISLVSAGIAIMQLRASLRQSRHQATFEHLGRVRKLLRQISEVNPADAREAALAYWTHQTAELPPHAKSYLDLLDEWDLLGVAYREKQVDRKMVLKALRYTFRNPHNVSSEFIKRVKETFANPGVYEDLDYLIQCCARPTLFEWLTAKGKVLYGYVRPQTRATSSIPSAAPEPIDAGADSGRRNTGVPPTPATTDGAEVSDLPLQGRDPMTEIEPMSIPSPQVPVSRDGRDETPPFRPAEPLPPPPPPPSREERGETPAFRPPPPPPPRTSGNEG